MDRRRERRECPGEGEEEREEGEQEEVEEEEDSEETAVRGSRSRPTRTTTQRGIFSVQLSHGASGGLRTRTVPCRLGTLRSPTPNTVAALFEAQQRRAALEALPVDPPRLLRVGARVVLCVVNINV